MTTAQHLAPAELRRLLEEDSPRILLAGLGAWLERAGSGAKAFGDLVKRGREAVDSEELSAELTASGGDLAWALTTLLQEEGRVGAETARTPEQILEEAQAAIWQLPMLTSSEAGRQLGSTASNPRELPRRLREESSLLGLPGRSGYRYPRFQIDPRKKRLHPEVAEVNRILEAAADPWGVASWWMSPNDRLGVPPMDLVGSARASAVVRVAEGMLANSG
jgi:hypothetical protein